jgi:hypothetical protein
MRLRRRLPIIVGVLLVAAAVAVVVVMRKHAPPEAARLLPQGDGFLYFNLRDLRRAGLPGKLPAVPHEPEYEQFIQATGFQFENDLDEAAFAIHYPTKRSSGEARYSEVLIGKVQVQKLRDYLQKISKSIENYRSIDIYSIPLEGRTLRVAILGVDTVAASNVGDPQVIRGMIDRSRKMASPFGGPSLLRKYYKYVPLTDRYVPFTSLGWSVFRIDPSAENAAAAPMGMSLIFSKPAVVVVSARYLRSVRVRAEAFTDDEDEAKRVTDQLNTFLTFFQSAETSAGKPGVDPDIKQLFDSLQVKQNGDRSVLTAEVPTGFIAKAVTGPSDRDSINQWMLQPQTAAPSAKHEPK